MIKGIIFDLENGLIRTAEARKNAWTQLAQEQGISFDDKIYSKMEISEPQKALELLLSRSYRNYHTAEKLALLTRGIDLLDEELAKNEKELMHSANISLLAKLKQDGYRIAAVSTAISADTLIHRFHLKGMFDSVDASFPDAANNMNLEAEECLVLAGNPLLLADAAQKGFQCMEFTDGQIFINGKLYQ